MLVLRSVFVALAAILISGLVSEAVRADDLPFWERGVQAKTVKAKTAATRVRKSYKSYASKSYAAGTKKLGGYAEATEAKPKRHKGVRVAALGGGYYPEEKPRKSLSGGGVSWTASSGCLDGNLKAIIYQVAANYGSLRVNSTCRSRGHNRAVGGAPRSKHLSGNAVDFRVFGNTRAVYAFLKRNSGVGGLKHYGGGLFHIDNGERRSW